MTNLKIIGSSILLLIACNAPRKLTDSHTYNKECCLVNNKNEIVEVKYFSGNNNLQSLFIVDFESKQSFYIEKSMEGTTICKGGFDVNSYDSTTNFTEAISYLTPHRDGVYGIDEHNFKVMKNGVWSYYYYSNGVLQMQGGYLQNQRHGAWRYYGPDANLEIIRIYHLGAILKDSIVTDGLFIIPPD